MYDSGCVLAASMKQDTPEFTYDDVNFSKRFSEALRKCDMKCSKE